MKHQILFLGFGLLTAWVGSLASEPDRVASWEVVRRGDGAPPGPLSTGVQQQIAEALGAGHYLVTNRLASGDYLRTARRVIFVFATRVALDETQPLARFVVDGSGACARFDPDDDGAMIRLLAGDVDATEAAAAIGLGLFGGRARSLSAEKIDPTAWRERYLVDGRFLYDVVIHRSDRGFEVLERNRHDRSSLPASEGARPVVEEWTIDHTAVWHATKRYQIRLAYVALSHDARRMYRLGVELLADPTPGAAAQGLRLVKEAAAAGYGDAQQLVAEMETGAPRRGPEREPANAER